MKLYLIRHTSVAVAKGICYGQTDVPLSESFEEEAQVVKKNLEGIKLSASYASPLTRCKRLAQFCVGNQGIQLDDRLKEMDYGAWEMKDWNTLDFSAWEKDWVHQAVPQGESFYELFLRVSSFLNELAQKHLPTEQLAIFTHGGVLACALAYFEGIPLEESFARKAKYGDIFTFHLV